MKLIEELLTYKEDIDAIQIAEILWLTKTISQSTVKEVDTPPIPKPKPKGNQEEYPDTPKPKGKNNPPVDTKDESLPEEVEHTIVIQKAKEQPSEYGVESNSNSSSYVTDIVHKYKYPNIIKQFQSLRIKKKRLDKTLLDEDKSADYIATTELFHPIFRESKDRESYLTLHLIVDVNESMFLWEDSIEHFKKSLLNSKLFENIVIFNIDTKEEKATLTYAKSKRRIEPTSNIFKKEKSLTLLFTDVIGKAWRTNDVFKHILNPWSKHTFVTIVSMLPKRMWQRTPLHQGVSLFMKSHKFLPKNSDLKSEYDFIENTFGAESNKIPIIPYDKYGFEYLSHILTAKKGSWIDTRVFDGLEDITLETQSTTEIDAKERVDSFFASSTPDTIKLAIYCSVLPLHKKIIEKLIRVKKIGNDMDAFSEFYFGGLLDKSVQKDQKVYSFYTGVRRELVSYITMDEVESIYHILDDVIKESVGSKRSMLELLYAQEDVEYKLSDEEKGLIELLIEILGEKGRFYKKNIENLTRLSNTVYPEKNWFMMGSVNTRTEQPIHKITFNYNFEIGKYPVTFDEYDFFCKDTGRKEPNDNEWGRKKRPVINISWNDALAYIEWLNNYTHLEYRLPTEAEWEYVAKSSEKHIKSLFPDTEGTVAAEAYAWKGVIGFYKTKDVSLEKINQWYVSIPIDIKEWCQDTYSVNYKNTPVNGSAFYFENDKDNIYKILRGGENNITLRFREKNNLYEKSCGFRLARTLNNNTIIENTNTNFINPIMVKIIHPKPQKSFKLSMIKVPLGVCIMYYDFVDYNVEIINNFEIGKFLVTFEEYDLFCEDTGFTKPKDNGFGRGKKPIINVSWYDAVKYCEWLSKKSNNIYRLPYKAEWIYACRAGTSSKWSFGDNVEDLDKHAWYEDNSNKELHDVGLLESNHWGLYDCHGLVKEWCEDWFDEHKDIKNVCGGSWIDQSHVTENDSVDKELPEHKYDFVGFRIVKSSKKEKNFQLSKIVIPKYLTTIPQINNNAFLARKNELKEISQLIENDKSLVLDGSIGVGKTSLVLKYIDLHESEYQHIAYISNYTNLKINFINALEESLQITGIDNILLKLKNLPNKKILIIDNVTSDIQYDEKYLNTLYKSGWIIVLITQESKLGIMTKGHYTLGNFNSNVEKGVIKSLKNGFGFISYANFRSDIFFHANNLTENVEFDDLAEGQHVIFEIGAGRDGKNQAINIEIENVSELDIKEIELKFHEKKQKIILLQKKLKNLSVFVNNVNYDYGKDISNNINKAIQHSDRAIRDMNSILKTNSILEGNQLIDNELTFVQDNFDRANKLLNNYDYSIEDKINIELLLEDIRHLLNYLINSELLNTDRIKKLQKTKKIYISANGKVYKFEVNDEYYDIEIHKISEQTIHESQATREMVTATGATHQGTIKFKDNQQGNIEELNKLIDEQFNKEYGLAFYSIIDEEKDKEDYINFIEAESEMEGWFYDNYDDPANFLPYETREGGYQYLYGGPYELDEVLYDEFSTTYPDEQIQYVIKTIERQHGDLGWAKKPDENEGYVESDDPYDPNIREQEIKQMEADALEKAIEDREKELAKIQSSNDMIESQINGDFNGWEGETIIKLMNGELWQQSKYYYQYMYAYMPKVTIVNSPTGYKMKVDGINKEVGIKKLENAIQSNILGSFNGWDGNTIVELTNGEKWKQSSYSYSYSYAYNPDVIIYESDYGYKMKVDGNDEIVDVERYDK